MMRLGWYPLEMCKTRSSEAVDHLMPRRLNWPHCSSEDLIQAPLGCGNML